MEPDPAAGRAVSLAARAVGDGLRLTQAGRLAPAVVEETMRARGWDADWICTMNQEDQTYPVQKLRELARRMGLLRNAAERCCPPPLGRRLTEDPARRGAVEGAKWAASALHPKREPDEETSASG